MPSSNRLTVLFDKFGRPRHVKSTSCLKAEQQRWVDVPTEYHPRALLSTVPHHARRDSQPSLPKCAQYTQPAVPLGQLRTRSVSTVPVNAFPVLNTGRSTSAPGVMMAKPDGLFLRTIRRREAAARLRPGPTPRRHSTDDNIPMNVALASCLLPQHMDDWSYFTSERHHHYTADAASMSVPPVNPYNELFLEPLEAQIEDTIAQFKDISVTAATPITPFGPNLTHGEQASLGVILQTTPLRQRSQDFGEPNSTSRIIRQHASMWSY